ncbi:MAG: hypothetical protein AB1563_06315 [Bacillota bacterium]
MTQRNRVKQDRAQQDHARHDQVHGVALFVRTDVGDEGSVRNLA